MASHIQGRVLIIAGSDSGGGAGIQGDLKTVQALGGYGMTAITALTAQNTLGVSGIHPVPPAFITQQIQLCLEDIGADAIKTGMLHSQEVIEAVVTSLPQRGRVRVGAKPALRFPKPQTLTRARELRQQLTEAEKTLWQQLRQDQLGIRFRKQHPFGPYILDFTALEAGIVIELDGGQHHTAQAVSYDEERTLFLNSYGFRVLRFWNHDVLTNLEGVVGAIKQALTQVSPHPNPPPLGEGIIPLVVDPVMLAKGGAPLLEPAGLDALRNKLIPRANIITPNLPEAEFLLGAPIAPTSEAMIHAAQQLLALGCAAVLLKGGHAVDAHGAPLATLTDILVTRETEPLALTAKRIDTRHTHGTGCTFASAIATGLAQQLSLQDAVRRAHTYVQQAIARAPGFGHGHGPLGH